MKTKTVKIGNATLYLGDCFKVLPKLDVEFDAVISDPPFAITDCSWDIKIPLDKFWEMIESITKTNANYVMFGCGKFTYELRNSKYKWHRYDLIWQKSKKVGFLNANLMPMRNHETILIFGRPGSRRETAYNPQKSLGGKAGVKTINHHSSVYRDTGEYVHVSDGTRHPGSVLTFPSEAGFHSTQKPLGLMEHLIKTYTNEGETVLDCFMGSASTGIACVKHNRRFIGIEQDKGYFDVAVKRIKEAYKELSNGRR
jgi:site-specific DNA-methyltransferase (adenine-specific)